MFGARVSPQGSDDAELTSGLLDVRAHIISPALQAANVAKGVPAELPVTSEEYKQEFIAEDSHPKAAPASRRKSEEPVQPETAPNQMPVAVVEHPKEEHGCIVVATVQLQLDHAE